MGKARQGSRVLGGQGVGGGNVFFTGHSVS